jgi:hypothetical protein
MPAIRVMNWNIEQPSWNKVNKPGMLNAIARTVNAENIDVLVLLEVRITKVMNAMTALSAALGSAAGGGTGAAALWVPKMLSHYATCAYSWISRPSRSRRSIRTRPLRQADARARRAVWSGVECQNSAFIL